MKNLLSRGKTVAFMIVMLLSATCALAQGSQMVASRSGCYYNTSPGSYFTWNGGCSNGYCDGFGTIQWYDSYGNPTNTFTGWVKQGKNEGYGTLYYPNGGIFYQGNWVNDEIPHIDGFKTFGYNLGNFIMNKIFDGGTKLQTTLVELIDADGAGELKIRVEFNGDIVTTNYYAFTVVISKQAPYINFENVNDLARLYMLYKLHEIIKEISDYLNSNDN